MKPHYSGFRLRYESRGSKLHSFNFRLHCLRYDELCLPAEFAIPTEQLDLMAKILEDLESNGEKENSNMFVDIDKNKVNIGFQDSSNSLSVHFSLTDVQKKLFRKIVRETCKFYNLDKIKI